jgi:hypothetical protein
MDPLYLVIIGGMVVFIVAMLIYGIVGGLWRNRKVRRFMAEHPEAAKLYFIAPQAGNLALNSITEGHGMDFNFGGGNRGLLLLPGPVDFKLTYLNKLPGRKLPLIVTGEFTVMARQGSTYLLHVDEASRSMRIEERK